MGAPIRIRAKLADGNADVRVLMSHPMESGARKDASGKLVPALYITDVSATLNGSRTVLSAQWGVAVSQDPFLWFRFGGAKAGDKLAVSWKDNTGDSRTDEIALA
ncbi:MAG: thiosulfate oxidation carrier complex protein SoxZ [Rubrivivax sp.]|nr:thiosulfate oxidation carrier complex protein SoxZ [Rubrivivax sp.]